MTDLARSFPSLRLAPGVNPWEPERLDLWASDLQPTDPARLAAQFVLAVF